MTDSLHDSLLLTKLNHPRLPNDLLQRSRLLEWLDHDIDHQLFLVCAPAGFGKSTLVGTWLEHVAAGKGNKVTRLPSAWLSLDENDSDLNLFLRYFIAALRTVFKEACEETLALLQARQQPSPAVLYTTFSNELEGLPGDFIIVLDDYHTLHGVEVHQLMSELARHWPKPLHLVLISRISPPIPLDSLRAKGMISEIRTRDLRFTHEETADYLSKSQSALLSQNALPLLEERFEGWPAGLHLAALSLRNADSQESVLMALSSENTNITGYLVDEVLSHQFPAVQTFLLKTSILDRFCASLCEAVIGKVDAEQNVRACLDLIERAELFLIPLDNRREWYRYHHLFQELLQHRLSVEMTPDQVTNLHRQASAWFEEHGLTDGALHHALAAGDLELAAHQMNAGLRDVLNREDRPTLERWLRLLPEEMIQRSPGLLMIRVWALQFLWRLDLQAQVLQQVEKLLDSDRGASLQANDLQLLRGQILAARSQHAYFSNRPTGAIDLCRQALALVPPSWTFVRGGAMLYLGMSMQASGQAPAAERLLLDEYESCSDKTRTYALFLLQSLGFVYLNTGQLEQARQIAQVLLQGASLSGVAIMKNWADWFLGLASYQRNDLEAAAQYFSQIVDNRFTAQISVYRDAVAGLAMIDQIKGESADACRMMESISQFDLEQRGSEDPRTRSLRARLMLLQGDLESAGNWVNTFNDLPPDQSLMWLEEPQVTRARVLVARGTDADMQLALKILDILNEIAARTHTTRYEIEILALRALAQDAQGKTRKANVALKQAVDLATPGGFIRVFADLGKPMQNMLRQIAKEDHSSGTIHRILAAFPADNKNRVDSESPASTGRYPSLGISILAEPLTPREFEILCLLREPLSMQEIALKLDISYETVRRHTANIYGKLGVNQRWKAVARAEELNILPQH
jgi:LuxR family transcriptional regulator, maltose regulon positive regulatory protein